jgi:cytochrome c peroxidase
MKIRLIAASIIALGFSAGIGFAQSNEPIQVIKPPAQINLGMVELGKKLYFDPRLSKSGFISCNSCHNLSMGGTDNIPTSIGDKWQQGPINAPTVLNSSLNVAQFWDGRAADLKAQAGGPIANPGEMAFTHTLAIGVLESIPQYVREFKQVFGKDKITIEEVTLAIAEFEKTLVTPNSPFDQWLLGKADALNADEKAGYKLFKESGCVACHNGPAVGGASFQKMGLVAPYKANDKVEGRSAVTGKGSLFQQAAQHPGGLLVHLESLRQQIGRRLVVGLVHQREQLARGAGRGFLGGDEVADHVQSPSVRRRPP